MNKLKSNKLPGHIQFDTVSPATKLLEKRRKMYEVHEAFEAQKEEFRKQEEQFKKQEEMIRDRDMSIQEDLIKFCKFLQENDAKKKRAKARFDDEFKLKELKEKEIEEYTAQIEELKEHQTKLKNKVEALKKYEEYLESVIKAYPDQYQDLNDLLNRYRTLQNSNENLTIQQKNMEEKYEKLKHDLITYEKKKNDQILQLNNDIKDLAKRLEEKQNERNNLSSIVELRNNDASSRNLNLGRILMAIDNIYSRCYEGSQKIRYELSEMQQDKEKKEKKNDKKSDIMKNNRNEQQDDSGEQQDNYEAKAKVATEKMMLISRYISDYKKIIENCQSQIKQSKIDKMQKEK